ncbi:LuxR C-terminal-related transcriptional regulator [Streptomyces sp. NPDC050738]|uniref:ATP-binding protein n=1 Tax=Streptomyces sp. NPDC050738 TaxID=3154744 RepID=UPI0034312A75
MAGTGWAWQRGELPSEMTSFIGRESEIEAVRALFGEARMVTLLGPGGVGKTRIAVRAAASLADRFRDGVRMVELAGVKDGELLPHAVGAAFGLPETSDRSALDMVVEFLRPEQTLLVLDTCEHLVDACALFAEILLSSCPGLRLLLTSRQALDVPAEHALAVAPLEESDAVGLFVQRAAAARPGFVLADTNREQVLALCGRLDGIPLALELAAVRLRALPLEQVLRRLEDRFRALGGGRSAHPRHQTLRTTIDWSHELCTPEEQTLWARLSLFAGGFDLDAAERVCADAELDAYAIVDHLIGLVDKSVVVREESEDGDRYRMLDTIREYGAERLAASADLPGIARRHRDHYLRLARDGYAAWFGGEQVSWTHRLDLEIDNFRTAMEWSLSTPGEEADGVGLIASLHALWVGRCRLAEGLRWGERGLATAEGTVQDRALLRFQHALCMGLNGDMEPGIPEYLQAAAEAESVGDRFAQALYLLYLGTTYLHLDRNEESARTDDEVEPLVRSLDSPYLQAWLDRNRGMRLGRQMDVAGAEPLLLRSLENFPRGEVWAAGTTYITLTFSRMAAGDPVGAMEYARRGLRGYARLPDTFGIANLTALLVWSLIMQGRCAEAAQLAGGSAAVRRGLVPLLLNDPVLLAMDAQLRTQCQGALGEEEFARLYAEGETLGMRRTVALALGDPVVEDAAPSSVRTLDALTRREREVATLVHQGLSNREIAEKLVISKRTADAHVEHILAKLGFGSRGEIAALVRAEIARADLPR